MKEAQHVSFDEGFAGEKDADVPPNVRLLRAYGSDDLDTAAAVREAIDLASTQINLDVDESPFLDIETLHLPFRPSDDHPLGLSFHRCSQLLRAYVSGIHSPAQGFKLSTFRKRFLGSYIVAIDDNPVFSLDDVYTALDRLQSLETLPSHVAVTVGSGTQEPCEGFLHSSSSSSA